DGFVFEGVPDGLLGAFARSSAASACFSAAVAYSSAGFVSSTSPQPTTMRAGRSGAASRVQPAPPRQGRSGAAVGGAGGALDDRRLGRLRPGLLENLAQLLGGLC